MTSDYQVTSEYQALTPISSLDDLIFQRDDVFRLSAEQIREHREAALRSALRHHLQTSPEYRRYCESLGFPADSEPEEWSRVPLIPSASFKEVEVLSGARANITKRCTSSGTKGSISQVLRDDVTLNRFLGSVNLTVEEFLRIDDAYCFNLGPSAEEEPYLWFSYAMAAVSLLFPTTNCVQDGTVRFDLLTSEFERAGREYESVLIVGAPVMVLNLLNEMTERGIFFERCERLVVATAGGWKRFGGQEISRGELFSMLSDRFRGVRRENFRDILNLVELNTVLAECTSGWKHVPPWVLVRIINPVTMADVEPGQEGLIGYLDASTTSYPGFIVSDDIGLLAEGDVCDCGRTGQRLTIIRRVISEESRGCALKLDRDFSQARGE